MRTLLAIVVTLVLALSASAITIDTVLVGNAGNPNDPATGNLYGGVSYAYNIGKYEVTVGQYTAFLNAVAGTDTYNLYNTSMQSDANIAGISQSCSPNCTYSVIGSADHPVTYVNWGDAARFANWLHNGQPTGPEDLTTTEDGAYFLNGATTRTALLAVTRKAGGSWFIPTENEWYKAAYYQPAAAGGDSDGYWAYPMKTNTVPNSAIPPGMSAPDATRVGNFYADDGVGNANDNGYAVAGSTSYSSTQNYLSDVGAYISAPSYYGTFDQGGNVREWNETKITSLSRGLRGGAWNLGSLTPQASARGNAVPEFEDGSAGFRVARVHLLGDYNGNGVLDAADYVLWRKNPANFGNAAGYNTWRTNFGQTISGSGAGVNMTVPEPSAVLLLYIGSVAMIPRRRLNARRLATSAGLFRIVKDRGRVAVA